MAEKRVVLITASGGGIGTACARELARREYRLALLARSEAVDRLAGELGGISVRGSVTDPEALELLVSTAAERFGRIDAMVVNTGHPPGSMEPSGRRFDPEAADRLLELTDEEWREAFDLYFLPVVRLARLVTPRLQVLGGGAIVAVSAFAAREPSWAYPASSTIRRALAGFVKLYADRHAADGIRMNAVLPGYLDNCSWSEEVVRSIPAGRAGSPEEIARVVAFLLSDDAAYVTGQGLAADGGLIGAV